jgi:hypothetical protein
MDSPRRKEIAIPCSPRIEAMIHFVGLASPKTGRNAVKLWVVNLNLTTEVGSYGTDLFGSLEEAKTFVDEYTTKGCPLGLALLRFREQYHRRNSKRE